MSITFWCPAAPTEEVFEKCVYCDGTLRHPYVMGGVCNSCNKEGGEYVQRSTFPEINMSNSNAYAFLELFGLELDYCGSIPVEVLPDLAVKAKLLSVGITAPFLEKETVEEGNIILCGRDTEYVRRRGSELFDLFHKAHQAGYPVVWG